MRSPRQTDLEFFEQRVFKPDTPCWNWRAYINRRGYGTWNRKSQSRYAHRVAYELLVGPIPDGLEVHHRCCNRSCVNPDHLELVTHEQNMGEVAKLRTHCKYGHELVEENIWRSAKGYRYCRTCRAERSSEQVAKEQKRPEYGRHNRECKNGHPRTPENVEWSKDGKRRRCRLCRIEGKRKPGGYKDPNRQRATHCPQGHEYTPENTYTHPDGKYRYCRTCNRAAVARAKTG